MKKKIKHVHIYGIGGKCCDCGRPELTTKQRALVDKGLADAKAGRIVSSSSVTPAGKTIITKVEVDWPICVDFFNDSRKPINIRTTPWTHAKNPEVILPLESKKIYIQQGFLKLWDNGDHFQLLVE